MEITNEKLIELYRDENDSERKKTVLNKLVRKNVASITCMTNKLKSIYYFIERCDIYQDCCMEFIDTIRRYDADKGALFNTYFTYSAFKKIKKEYGKRFDVHRDTYNITSERYIEELLQKDIETKKVTSNDESVQLDCKSFYDTLSIKEQIVFDARYNPDNYSTQKAVGHKIGMTKQAVYAIEKKIVSKFKKYYLE